MSSALNSITDSSLLKNLLLSLILFLLLQGLLPNSNTFLLKRSTCITHEINWREKFLNRSDIQRLKTLIKSWIVLHTILCKLPLAWTHTAWNFIWKAHWSVSMKINSLFAPRALFEYLCSSTFFLAWDKSSLQPFSLFVQCVEG